MELAKARFDWLVELGGALSLGLAAGYSALKAAPSLALPGPTAMAATGFACFGLGMVAMRAVKPSPRHHALPELQVEAFEADELLLDQLYEEPLLLEEIFEDKALLLEDRLAEPGPGWRVVQLFSAPPTPTPGQLKDRIDRHLAGAPQRTLAQMPPSQEDASEALYAALDELRRSLR